ncbi:centrosomal protein of 89 kDa isoform X2 [Gadus morhua]|uniref:centrosomal protein of 89 kDa isoform X2 n=1 Tax=Gadus morhua TaxID=8049 RepID=UPI0011B691D0|nr:centrosomal protein of 89 kDa isoform X2 [Gadus morhua]
MASPSSLFSSMSKFSFRRRDKDFKHIAPGLVPSASIAPKPAVPRTPPPRSPAPSPERPRSALAAAILSSSLTGRTFAIPPAGPRTLSAAGRSLSFSGLPQEGAAPYSRDKWSGDHDRRPRLPSPGSSDDEEEEELQYEEEDEDEEVDEEEADEEEREEPEELSDEEQHIYQTLDGQASLPVCLDRRTDRPVCVGRQDGQPITEPVYTLPVKAKRIFQEEVNSDKEFPQESDPYALRVRGKKPVKQLTQQKFQSDRSNPAQDVTVETSSPSPKTGRGSSKRNTPPPRKSSEPSEGLRGVLEGQQQAVLSLTLQNAALASERRQLQETLSQQGRELLRGKDAIQDLQARLSRGGTPSPAAPSPAAPSQTAPTGVLEEQVQNLKLTVHRLSVELSRYQAQTRPLGLQQGSRTDGLPTTSSPQPWLSDMKYLSPLLLAYEDRMAEKDALLQAVKEEVTALRVRVEEVVTENQTLHDRLVTSKGVSQQDWCGLQEKAALVLKENQVLLDQLEAQQKLSQTSHSQHQTEVTRLTKRLMLMEEEGRVLQVKMEEEWAELRTLRSRMKEAVPREEHCGITGKLHRQLEQEERRRVQEVEKMHAKVLDLEDEKRVLQAQNSSLTQEHRTMEQELQLSEQARRKACSRQAVLGGQLEESVRQEEEARLLLANLLTLAQRSTLERDHLALLATALEQEKAGGVRSLLEGTLRLRKLHDKVKVYRGRVSAGQALAERRQRDQESALASSQREILRLRQQLGDRQSTLDTVLQSKQDLEAELGVVWEAATREEQGMRETLLNNSPSRGVQSLGLLGRTGPDWFSEAAEPSAPLKAHHHHHSANDVEKLGLDFYS